MEIKQIEKQKLGEKNNEFSRRINNEIDKTINQINRNKYYKERIDNKIKMDKIVKVPIVFAGKEPYLTMIEEKK